jgi:hypothetical protein
MTGDRFRITSSRREQIGWDRSLIRAEQERLPGLIERLQPKVEASIKRTRVAFYTGIVATAALLVEAIADAPMSITYPTIGIGITAIVTGSAIYDVTIEKAKEVDRAIDELAWLNSNFPTRYGASPGGGGGQG